MNRIWFDQPLETVATWWRVLRRDGVALGFTTHDRDLWFGGVLHQAAPGMVPSAIRRSADFEPDSAEVEGALSHAAISSADLAAGRYDGAKVTIGLVDWETFEETAIYKLHLSATRMLAATPSVLRRICALVEARTLALPNLCEAVLVLQGLEDFIVVESDGVLMVCKKQDEQQIRNFVNDVKVQKGDKFV